MGYAAQAYIPSWVITGPGLSFRMKIKLYACKYFPLTIKNYLLIKPKEHLNA
jgi:hypothetical protein